MRVLLTGSAGFIGHHVLEALLSETKWDIVGLDRLDCSSTLERLRHVSGLPSKRFKHIWHDLRAPVNDMLANLIGPVDIILHLAASTHVDRSIVDALPFVYDNVVGTAHMLEYARALQGKQGPLTLFYYQSTDEVFGPAPDGVAYKEWDRFHASNPYAATKAAAEELALSYHNTYGVPVVVGHLMNCFGPRQHPEKFLPLVINRVMNGYGVQIHSDRTCTVPGSRVYLHARTAARAILAIIESVEKGTLTLGDKINIPGGTEIDNLRFAQIIAEEVGQPLKYELVSYHANRPGHDLHYRLDDARFKELGISYGDITGDIRMTVRWYMKNKAWLRA